MKRSVLMLLLAACSSSSTPSGGTSDSGTSDATVTDSGGDAANDTDSGDAASPCQACPVACCGAGEACVSDALGNKSCTLQCTHSSECTVGTNTCCLPDAVGQGLCGAPVAGKCLCATAADCTTALGGPSCAPAAISDVATGNYVCKPADGLAWDGCQYGYQCPTGYSCWGITSTDGFCARNCETSATCGNPGNACCVDPDAGAVCVSAQDAVPCTGPGACMPCGG